MYNSVIEHRQTSPMNGSDGITLEVIAASELTDLGSSLRKFSRIDDLIISDHAIRDLHFLRGLTNIYGLTLRGHHKPLYLKSFDEISSLDNLQKMYVGMKDISFDFSCIKKLKNLKEIHITFTNSMKNIECLRYLTGVEKASIGGRIRKIDFVSNWRELRTINIGGDVESFAGLEQCKEVQSMRVIYCKIKDISPISNLEKLAELEISSCPHILSYEPIQGAKNIRKITLENIKTPCLDISFLRDTNVKEINLLNRACVQSIIPLPYTIEDFCCHTIKDGDLSPILAWPNLRFFSVCAKNEKDFQAILEKISPTSKAIYCVKGYRYKMKNGVLVEEKV